MTARAAMFALIAVTVAACASAIPAPSTIDVDRARGRWPAVTLSDLDSGLQLYRARCSACHQLYAPDRFPPDRWPPQVAEMSERASLTPDEQQRVVQYLVAMADRSPRPKSK